MTIDREDGESREQHIERLRAAAEATAQSLERAQADQDKEEAIAGGYYEPDVEDMLTTAGIDDFFVDDKGQILIGNEVVGGKEQPLDDVDSMNTERGPGAFLSPAERARLHLPGGRDEKGQFTKQSEEPDPQAWSEPCAECSTVGDINRVTPEGLSEDSEGQRYLKWTCKCGCSRETIVDSMSDSAQARAVESAELMDYLAAECEDANRHLR